MRPPTTNPGPHYGFHDRLQALRQDSSSGSSILSGSPTPPLPAIAENWEIHSADSVFSDSASSCGSDHFGDIAIPSASLHTPSTTSARSQPGLDEVKLHHMDPLDGFQKEPLRGRGGPDHQRHVRPTAASPLKEQLIPGPDLGLSLSQFGRIAL